MQALPRCGQGGGRLGVKGAAGEGVEPGVTHLVQLVAHDGMSKSCQMGPDLVLTPGLRSTADQAAAAVWRDLKRFHDGHRCLAGVVDHHANPDQAPLALQGQGAVDGAGRVQDAVDHGHVGLLHTSGGEGHFPTALHVAVVGADEHA